MEQNLTAVIRSYADLLLDKHATEQSISPHLGHNPEPQPGVGSYYTPIDKRFKSVWLGVEAEEGSGSKTVPLDLEVTLQANAPLRLSDLVPTFGRWRHGTPAPHGNPYVVRYDYHPAHAAFYALLHVYLNKDPEAADAHVTQVSIVRYPKY